VTNAPVLDPNNQPVGNETTQIDSLEQYRRALLFERLGYASDVIRQLGGGASQFSISAGNPLVKFHQTDLALYGLDDWRALPNLTVSLGLRYEVQNNVHDWKDFGPRVALAWSPNSSNGSGNNTSPQTVVRAGWGTFYDLVSTQLIQQTMRFNGITEQQYVVMNPVFYPAIPAINSLAGGQISTI
jgi:outer membrane receptor protein involved in Fe transport